MREEGIKRAKRWASCVGDGAIAQVRHFHLRSSFQYVVFLGVNREDEAGMRVIDVNTLIAGSSYVLHLIDTVNSSICDMRRAGNNRGALSRACDFTKLVEDFAKYLGFDCIY